MSWQITIADDSDTTGERTITATWTEADEVFFYSERFPVNAGGKAAFIGKAIAKRDNWQQKESNEKTREVAYLMALNAADPKVVK